MSSKSPRRKRGPGDRLKAARRIAENSPRILLLCELYDVWQLDQIKTIWLHWREELFQLIDRYIGALPLAACLLLVALIHMRGLFAKRWFITVLAHFWCAVLSALVVAIRPDHLAAKLCLVIFISLFFRYLPAFRKGENAIQQQGAPTLAQKFKNLLDAISLFFKRSNF
jgi:hypothetical protein